ncbi:hypothetical protein VSS74_12925 [Conexibacter stalactiti]|uniref:Uncharacterized protein n=1 Tax=Conexibacter stalactiti TaxID=1940611 RepID=A0ABU4HPN3_9ACTN|nr:hypothetical protein [Conexibacter stalactiti]MDW5595246.1 hypothetical protein [Conexibacter stalactiti]MEC5035888.1 hypothetical protein [Conexibacter stalactiti]
MLACAAAAASASPAAADACPNAAVREQQGVTHLPDCRAYEVVSPVDKNGAAIRQIVAARPEGDGIAFWSTGAFAGAPGNLAGNYSAQRGADGWVTRALNPPVLGRNPILMDQPYVVAMSNDFSQALIETRYPVDPDDAFLGEFVNTGLPDVYRVEPDGSFHWLSPTATLPDRSGVAVVFGGATADLGTVVYRTAKQVSADLPAGSGEQLYARHGDQVTLLSVAPGGGPLPGGAVLGRNLLALETDSGSTVGGRFPSALSADGSTVWFSTKADPDVPQLYVRSDALDPAAAVTTQVSSSQATATLGDGCATQATFLAAAEDGATAWFTCASRLTDDAPAGGGLYRYDRGSGQLHFIVAALDGSDVGGQMTLVGADRDADHVWFSTSSQLTADAPTGTSGLYHLHDDAVTFVSTLSWPDAITASAVSPDGSRIAFATDDQLDADAGGVGQVYSVDADDPGSGTVCISCRPDGSTPLGRSDLSNAGADVFVHANNVPRRGNVASDGSIYFASADRLVADDVNETADVYQYRDGELTLLSSGSDELPSVFGAASDDGRDVFILTSETLAVQDTDNGAADVYSVRVDGGFAPTVAPPICGEDCQGPPPPAPVPPTPASATFTGPGDEDERVAAPVTPRLTVTAPSARQRTRWAASGRLTLAVRATDAGAVRARVSGRVRGRAVTVASASRRLARGGSARLTLRLSAAARRQLARSGSLRLTIVVTHSEVADPRRVTLTLRAPAATHRNGGRR